jgi:hypothetical protein
MERMTYLSEESKVIYESKDGKEEKVFDALEWLAAMGLSMKKKMIFAPTHAVLKNLAFVTGRGLKDEFLGIPRTAVRFSRSGTNSLSLVVLKEPP